MKLPLQIQLLSLIAQLDITASQIRQLSSLYLTPQPAITVLARKDTTVRLEFQHQFPAQKVLSPTRRELSRRTTACHVPLDLLAWELATLCRLL